MPGLRSKINNGRKPVSGFAPSKGARVRGSKATGIISSKFGTAIKVERLRTAGVTIRELKSIDAPQGLIKAYEKRLRQLLKKG